MLRSIPAAAPPPPPTASDFGDLKDWGHAAHSHSYGHLVTAIVGSGVLVVDGREHPFDSTHGVWVPPHVVHEGRFGSDLLPLAVDILDDAAVARLSHTGVRGIPIDAELRAVILAWGRDHDPAQTRQRERRIADAICDAPALREGLRLPVGTLTRPIMEHLRVAPAHLLSLEEWAAKLHASTASIRRAFLAETGRPYSEWTTCFRLELSTARLLGDEPVALIARAVGFSPNGYTLAFRRWAGCTPSEFRARARAQ